MQRLSPRRSRHVILKTSNFLAIEEMEGAVQELAKSPKEPREDVPSRRWFLGVGICCLIGGILVALSGTFATDSAVQIAALGPASASLLFGAYCIYRVLNRPK